MSEKNEFTSFIEEFKKAAKNAQDLDQFANDQKELAISEINQQIHAFNGKTIKLEGEIRKAKSNKKLALVNYGALVDDNYITNLLKAEQSVTDAENALKDHKYNLEFLKNTLKEIEK